MRTAAAAFLVGLAVSCALAAPTEPEPATTAACEEGKSWKDNCNSCTCIGGRAACTLVLCLTPAAPAAPAPTECTSGSTWKEKCNSCVCHGGVPLCTQMACPVVHESPSG